MAAVVEHTAVDGRERVVRVYTVDGEVHEFWDGWVWQIGSPPGWVNVFSEEVVLYFPVEQILRVETPMVPIDHEHEADGHVHPD